MALGAIASITLYAAAWWIHRRYGNLQAALGAAGAGIAGAYVTLFAATGMYDLIPESCRARRLRARGRGRRLDGVPLEQRADRAARPGRRDGRARDHRGNRAVVRRRALRRRRARGGDRRRKPARLVRDAGRRRRDRSLRRRRAPEHARPRRVDICRAPRGPVRPPLPGRVAPDAGKPRVRRRAPRRVPGDQHRRVALDRLDLRRPEPAGRIGRRGRRHLARLSRRRHRSSAPGAAARGSCAPPPR